MSGLCLARVSVDIPRCNAPAAPRSLRDWPLCERHVRMSEDVEARWGRMRNAPNFVPPTPAGLAEIVSKPAAPTKQSRADEEAFAAMKRALANGFARHDPAYDDIEIATEEAA